MSKNMPSNIVQVRDAAIEFAYGRKNLPEDIEDLYNWLFWESEDHGLDEFKLFFSLGDIELSDSQLMDEFEIADNNQISDQMRVTFARKMISQYVTCSEELVGAHAFELVNDKNEKTFICCMTESHGQGGMHPIWDGFYPTRKAYFEYLTAKSRWCDSEHLEKITDAQILSEWNHGKNK